ncbi:MAG: zf-HC2 domain-containing protein [candidate division Zixibacteria bacterium]|nr:zf-HC2 domain-containing protein [candidate division Zixibacteria bacterium]
MKTACVDKSIGSLIHAYELGLLSEEKSECFEQHLMKCDYCASEVKDFSPRPAMILKDPFVKNEIRRLDNSISVKSSFLNKIWTYLWPNIPVILRPAIPVLLVLLLIYPASRGLHFTSISSVKSIQSIQLFPVRSKTVKVPISMAEQDIVVSFVYEGSVLGKSYYIDIKDDSRKIIYSEQSYKNFDEYDRGHLLISGNLLQQGRYCLTISDPNGNTISNIQEYRFTIQPK